MEKYIGFKVIVEFDCTDMIDEKTFQDEFNCNPIEAYKFLSCNFKDSPHNFADNERVVKVELLGSPIKLDSVQSHHIIIKNK